MRIGAAIALLLPVLAADARCEVTLSAGTEHFAWSEDTSPFQVRERGARFALGLALAQPRPTGLRLGYRGRVYAGDVGYDGAYLFARTVPVSARTLYTGTTQRGEVRYAADPVLDAVGALDLDLWRRRLGSAQTEDYRVVTVRLGAERGARGSDPWRLGAGLRVPVWARENAHFTKLGFDQNPILEPRLAVSPYVEVACRWASHWTISGYWDGFHFSPSDRKPLTRRGVPQGSFYQPASDLRIIGVRLEHDL